VKEFTIRNKTTRPIMTLTPRMLAKMLAGRPESVSLVLAKRMRDYKGITGKALSLDYDQQQALLAHAGADARGMWTSRYSHLPYPLSQVAPIFADGFLLRPNSEGLSEDLALAESFHALLDARLTADTTSESVSLRIG
jgi:hypothetical protein